MIKNIDISEFARSWHSYPVIDVRSPKEYQNGHIPGVYNLPLFNDEERALVGTRYTRSGRFASVQMGLDLVGHRLSGYITTARELAKNGPLLMHCWRGGMRSSSMAWLMDLAGMDIFILKGGYKAYRDFIRREFSTPVRFMVLAGKTGSGKTDILQAIGKSGHQVLDLEKAANHRGSAFGGLGMMPQPTNEQYENELFHIWQKLDLTRPVWIEDESLSVGTVSIPQPLFEQLIASPVIEIEMDFDLRISRLVREYSTFPVLDLVTCIGRIEKKLGVENARKAAEAVRKGEFDLASAVLLSYYDKAYEKSLQKRAGHIRRVHLHLQQDDPVMNARILLADNYSEM